MLLWCALAVAVLLASNQEPIHKDVAPMPGPIAPHGVGALSGSPLTWMWPPRDKTSTNSQVNADEETGKKLANDMLSETVNEGTFHNWRCFALIIWCRSSQSQGKRKVCSWSHR